MDNRARFQSMIATAHTTHVNSTGNRHSTKSQSTNVIFRQEGKLKNLTQHDCRRVVGDIVSSVFEHKVGMVSVSSSQCSVSQYFQGSEDMDKRLKQWQDTLRDRAKLQNKLSLKTGRRPEEMLFNLPVTVEQRDKGTVQRVMDYASRLNPIKLKQRLFGVLPQVFDKGCVYVNEVWETLPRPERVGRNVVEISGLPKTIKQELFCSDNKSESKAQNSRERTKWLNSKKLVERIDDEAKDIQRILEFYPDVDNLEVIGTNPLMPLTIEHNEDIDLMLGHSLHSVSTITIAPALNDSLLDVEDDSEKEQHLEAGQETINCGIKINEQIFIAGSQDGSQKFDVQVSFECAPYEKNVKQVLRLENIGTKIVTCNWKLLENSNSGSFLFDHEKRMLLPGDVHIIHVLYQPRRVSLRTERWELRILPNVFCTRRNSIQLQLQGKCLPHPEYVNKINKQLKSVIDNSNEQATKNLAKHNAELATLIQPQERFCPYERVFDDRELFNAANPGYHCDRFDDIETLRALYNTVKLPREPVWDMRLATIKKIILRLTKVEEREVFFKAFLDIQEPLLCKVTDSSAHIEHRNERDRSRFIYVRGSICNGIEEWEDLMVSLEQSCLKSELIRFYARLSEQLNESEANSSDDEELKPWLRQLKYDQPEVYILRKLRGKKHFRDSLFMQTYTKLCDIAENIVSVIESTEHI